MKKKHLTTLIIILAILLVGFISFSFYSSSDEKYENAIIMDNNLIAYEVAEGAGEKARKGDTVSVYYIGTLIDGTVFDSNQGSTPFIFTIGAGEVIEGWERGLIGMRVGGTRRLAIPPELAYGVSGIPGAIPPNAMLLFEIELLAIE
jgi:FKBP-type peptidyl-prolyl cis-trans isomerase